MEQLENQNGVNIFKTTKKYKIILSDPPWKYRDKLGSDSAKMGACEYHYNTMSLKDICNLPVKDICDNNCILFLWTTMPKLNECQKVIKSWGFEYKTCAFVWIKLNPKAKTIFKGIGRWVQGNAELCLLATKGHPKRISKSISQVIMKERQKHSQKPPIIRDRIIELMGDLPRIELFARPPKDRLFEDDSYKGWDLWGNEV